MTVGTSHETFMELLKTIQNSMDGACTDLRSQVVKEACITLAFLSHQFKNKCATFIEGLLTSLINLLQNSAKVNIKTIYVIINNTLLKVKLIFSFLIGCCDIWSSFFAYNFSKYS